MKNKVNYLVGIMLAILMLASISAFGVSAPYWDGNNPNPLTMARGEIKTIELNLQNMVGDEDVNVVGVLIEGSDIALFKEDEFLVKAHTSDTIAPLKIKIPKDMAAGTTKKIIVEFKTVTSGEGGMVAMGTGMEISFDVIVTEEIAKLKIPYKLIISLAIGILVLAGIIWFVLKRKKPVKKSRKKKKKK